MATPTNNNNINNNSDTTNNNDNDNNCIYTWKQRGSGGGGGADLPSSFYEESSTREESHSPDFLEMDFDPGPTAPPPPPSPPPPTVNLPPSDDIEEEVSDPVVVPLPCLRLIKSNTVPTLVKPTCVVSSSQSAPLMKPISLSINGAMIWTLEEAFKKATPPQGPSSCGPTALADVLASLSFPTTPTTPIIRPHLRLQEADLPEYLISRSMAGTTAQELITAMDSFTNGQVYGRFFPPHSDLTSVGLSGWLLRSICEGATPLATLNPQAAPLQSITIPDAWHHQMIFGSTSEGIFLTNPPTIIPPSVLLPQLTAPSTLLIRREDILKRKQPQTDLRKLARIDAKWNELNVLGQVSSLLLQETYTHITIPAAYTAGITLFARSHTPACEFIQSLDVFIF